MEIAITVSAIIAMIIIGVLLIHRLNGRHDERIAAFHYGDALPGIGRRSRNTPHRKDMPGRPPSPPTRSSPLKANTETGPPMTPDLSPDGGRAGEGGAKRPPTGTASR
ncbi:hypothetical protein ACWGH4_02030 [Streptomyces sp. NPDC054847]|jgi:hypothetical protein